jgi:hypothetical protein
LQYGYFINTDRQTDRQTDLVQNQDHYFIYDKTDGSSMLKITSKTSDLEHKRRMNFYETKLHKDRCAGVCVREAAYIFSVKMQT